MLGGETPFEITETDNPDNVLKKLKENKLRLDGGNWDHVSADAKDLLRIMLHLDASKRPNAKNGK